MDIQKFENLLWSQVKHLPVDLKFLVINPSKSSVLHYMWYDHGRMRGSGGLPSLKVPMSLSFSSGEIELRGGILTAGTILELMAGQLVYIKIGLYDLPSSHNSKEAKALSDFISNKFGQRLDYLKKISVVDRELYRLTNQFMQFRNAISHSFTMQDIKYGSTEIHENTWKDVRETLRDDFDKLWAQWEIAYSKLQPKIIIYVADIIRGEQRKTGVVYPAAMGFGPNPIRDIRKVDDLEEFFTS